MASSARFDRDVEGKACVVVPTMNQRAVVIALALAAMPIVRADGIRFLPDDAQIACRAILPQCFTKQGWHRLCQNNPAIAKAHQQACRKAAIGLNEAVD